MSKVDEVWRRMNPSERHGVAFGLFPSWVGEDFHLTHDETITLMGKRDGDIIERAKDRVFEDKVCRRGRPNPR